jgi:hypothetical protein
MPRPIYPCPRCSGRLYLEPDIDGGSAAPPDWVCLQCGWRRTATPTATAVAAR